MVRTTLIDFPRLITGTAYIGIHIGDGGNYPGITATSFNRFDAGAGTSGST